MYFPDLLLLLDICSNQKKMLQFKKFKNMTLTSTMPNPAFLQS